MPTLLDPADPFEKIIIDMVELHRKKRADYADDDNPLSNFDYVSAMVPLPDYDPFLDCWSMVMRKIGRLRSLQEKAAPPKNESFEDSLIDLCVYSVLLLEIYRRDYGTVSDPTPVFGSGVQEGSGS